MTVAALSYSDEQLAQTQKGLIRTCVSAVEKLAEKKLLVLAVARAGDKLENVTRANVELGVGRLKGLDPILSKLVKSGELKVVGATYDLRTGKVQVLA